MKYSLPFLLIAILFAIFGAVTTILYLVFGLTFGPTKIRNQYIGLWISALILYFSLQTIYLTLKRLRFIINNFFYLDLIYFTLTSIGGLLLLIFFAFSRQKIDAIVLSSLLFVINVCNVLLLIVRRKAYNDEYERATNESIQMRPTVHLDKEPVDYYEHLRDDSEETCLWQFRRVLNVIFKIFFLLILIAMVANASTIGTGYLWYPARGEFSKVKLNDTTNRELKIHWLCDGPVNDSLPVFLFDGSGSHVMLDYLGLQVVLKEKNRRSCIFDLPGQGYILNYMKFD